MRESDTVPLSEFADRLGVAYSTAARWCAQRQLAAEKQGGQWRISLQEIERIEQAKKLAQETIVPFRAMIGELYRLRDHESHRLQAALDAAAIEYLGQGDRLEQPGYRALLEAAAPLLKIAREIEALSEYESVIIAVNAKVRESA